MLINRKFLKAKGIMTIPEPGSGKFRYHVVVDSNYKIKSGFKESDDTDIDNFVVYKDDKVIGFCSKKDLKGSALESRIIKCQFINEDDALYEVAEKLSEFVRFSPYYLLFVKDKHDEITGLINQADLNRWSCYLYSYLILLYVEKESYDLIKMNYMKDATLVEKIRNEKLREKFRSSFEEGIRECSTSDLKKIVNILPNADPVKKHLDLVLTEVGRNKKFRNIIAHTVNRIVEKQYTAEQLKDLAKIWREFWNPIMRLEHNVLNTGAPLKMP